MVHFTQFSYFQGKSTGNDVMFGKIYWDWDQEMFKTSLKIFGTTSEIFSLFEYGWFFFETLVLFG